MPPFGIISRRTEETENIIRRTFMWSAIIVLQDSNTLVQPPTIGGTWEAITKHFWVYEILLKDTSHSFSMKNQNPTHAIERQSVFLFIITITRHKFIMYIRWLHQMKSTGGFAKKWEGGSWRIDLVSGIISKWTGWMKLWWNVTTAIGQSRVCRVHLPTGGGTWRDLTILTLNQNQQFKVCKWRKNPLQK